MEMIELERWQPSKEDSGRLEYVEQRTAQEVFEELKDRLNSMGYLPDEYFLLNDAWENGRKVPKDADIFCTTDYGANEGVYLDVYLKWHESGKPITKSFITGKTLGESGSDLDRMFLISSAITKAFHGDHASHARYIQLGERPPSESMVLHLDPAEQRVFIEALTEHRGRMVGQVQDAERLLYRMTGGILKYMDEVGCRPLQISDADVVMLAVREGDLKAFQSHLPHAWEQADQLLILTAGRPGPVGRKMLQTLLEDGPQYPSETYMEACKKAIETGEVQRVETLLAATADHVTDIAPSFYGEALCYAYSEKPYMVDAVIRRCPREWIEAAPSRLFLEAAGHGDFNNAVTLIEKGIDTAPCVGRAFRVLYGGRNEWMIPHLLERGMRVNATDYSALHLCLQNQDEKAAKRLLDSGMDYDGYRRWAEGQGLPVEKNAALEEYWAAAKKEHAQQGGPRMGGMS